MHSVGQAREGRKPGSGSTNGIAHGNAKRSPGGGVKVRCHAYNQLTRLFLANCDRSWPRVEWQNLRRASSHTRRSRSPVSRRSPRICVPYPVRTTGFCSLPKPGAICLHARGPIAPAVKARLACTSGSRRPRMPIISPGMAGVRLFGRHRRRRRFYRMSRMPLSRSIRVATAAR